jgi:septum formation protein
MIYLASQSPRRRELLDQIKINYQTIIVTIDETPLVHELPQDYVYRLALAKAQAGYLALSTTTAPVLGADTIIICNNQILGKPKSKADAEKMLQTLAGRSHQVMTAVAVVTQSQKSNKLLEIKRLNTSTVYFRPLNSAEIAAYVATGEPLDKAGSYAIQGLASIFIERIEGSYSGVMGLPLYETAQILAKIGITLF